MKLTAIDPGRKGAIAISFDGDVFAYRLPFNKDDSLNIGRINQLLSKSDHVFFELPSKGCDGKINANAIYLGGYYKGVIESICELNNLPITQYHPASWMPDFFGYGAKVKNNGIKPSIKYCRQRYPTELLMPGRCTTIHDGITDALCLLEYGTKMMEKTHEQCG